MSERTQVRDVPALLASATRRFRVDEGTNLLVATDLEQNVLGAKRLPKRATYARRSRLAYDVLAPALEQILPSRDHRRGPTGIGYIIRGREGRAVPAMDDLEWAYTLLWACGSICCYTGDVVVVTQHGWRVVTDHGWRDGPIAGWTPSLAELSAGRLRAVDLPPSATSSITSRRS